MNNLTKRQKDILSVIEQDSNLSLSQIAKELGLSSVGNIHAHVKKLVDLGYIKKKVESYF